MSPSEFDVGLYGNKHLYHTNSYKNFNVNNTQSGGGNVNGDGKLDMGPYNFAPTASTLLSIATDFFAGASAGELERINQSFLK